MRLGVTRILDANLNRAREGLRVGEELARLVLEDASLQAAFKAARHGLLAAERRLDPPALLRGRAVERDPGAASRLAAENRRATWSDLGRANLRRAEEALRVLEEVSKLLAPGTGAAFKRLRFAAYVLEQRLLAGLAARDRKAARGRRRA